MINFPAFWPEQKRHRNAKRCRGSVDRNKMTNANTLKMTTLEKSLNQEFSRRDKRVQPKKEAP